MKYIFYFLISLLATGGFYTVLDIMFTLDNDSLIIISVCCFLVLSQIYYYVLVNLINKTTTMVNNKLYEKSLRILNFLERINIFKNLNRVILVSKSTIYLNLNRTVDALKAISFVPSKNDDINLKIAYYNNLTAYYIKLKNIKEANKNLQLYASIIDTIKNDDKKMKKFNLKYNLLIQHKEERENEIKELASINFED